MKDSFFRDPLTELGMTIVVCCTMSAVSFCLGRDYVRKQAIAAGVAEWTVDAQTGATEFRWKGDAK